MKKLLLLCGVLVLIGAGCYNTTADEAEVEAALDSLIEEATDELEVMEEEDSEEDVMEKDGDDATDTSAAVDEPVEYTLEAPLADVSGGTATGTAMAGLNSEGAYVMEATFEDLPALEDDYFYEGWVVRGAAESVISTGPAVDEGDGTFTNTFSSETDLTDHTKYVLTLEPDDNDPAPADHILDGTFAQK